MVPDRGIPFQGPPSLWDQATILFHDLIQGHYFVDGNKRIGLAMAFALLEKNGYEFRPEAEETYLWPMAVARGQKKAEEIRYWFRSNSY